VEILSKGSIHPPPWEETIAMIFAATNGFMDTVPIGDIKRFQAEFVNSCAPARDQLQEIVKAKIISDDLKTKLKASCADSCRALRLEKAA